MNQKLNCVLVIDDDEPTNFFNQMVLESCGCAENVKVTQSGEEALTYLTTSGDETANDYAGYPRPDLMFLDINMPAMDGWEFLNRYKMLKQAQKGKIVIVMLTTSVHPDDISRASTIPEISAFECKPLTQDKLNRILKKYFDSQCNC